ncbi:hypothetical protein ACHAXR_013431 [Thalassiosira sp. AJA248-18]
MKHFIFGYGSLICPQSRAITAPSLQDAIAEPVVINSIERTWSARVTKRQAHSSSGNDSSEPSSASNDRDHIRGWTPMGVRFRRGARCNGVLINVDEAELKRFDVRESGYVRRRIDLADIHRHIDSDKLIDESMALWPTSPMEEVVGDEDSSSDELAFREQLALEDVRCSACRLVFENASKKRRKPSNSPSQDDHSLAVWVYVQSENYPAERSFPITQSYVDIIMRGCLSVSHDFARRFLETTHGWWHDGNDHERNKRERVVVADDATKINTGAMEYSIEKHHTWVNDRHAPMYVRADSEYSLENGEEIDQLIKEHHPHALQRRVVSM